MLEFTVQCKSIGQEWSGAHSVKMEPYGNSGSNEFNVKNDNGLLEFFISGGQPFEVRKKYSVKIQEI